MSEIFKNNIPIKAVPVDSRRDNTMPTKKRGKVVEIIRHNGLFMIYVSLSVLMIGWLLVAFLPFVHRRINTSIIRQYKRPLPYEPTKYFDVSCIDIHDYNTFKDENQATLCYQARPFSLGMNLFGSPTLAPGK